MQFIDLKTQYKQIEKDIDARIKKVLEHGQYIMGPEVYELEERLAVYTEAKHAIAAGSGTDALLLALLALDIGPGDEVITTAFSFFASVETIALLGAKPVFVDIDPQTYNINPHLIKQAITDNTKAIMPVSLYGQCADFDLINEVAEKHNLPVIEDAAQSFGASYKGQKSCNLTTIACTSFFPSKPLGCYGDGGACFTNDDGLAEKIRDLRIHGQQRRYHHTQIGINGRMDTLQAAILLAKLEIFSEEVAIRQTIGERYTKLLQDYVITPTIELFNTSVYAQYTIQVTDRDEVKTLLADRKIPTAVHYPKPLHHQPIVKSILPIQPALPMAEAAADSVLSLPMHPNLSEAEQDLIVSQVQEVVSVIMV